MEPEPEPAADGAPTAASIPTRVVVTLFAGHSLPAEDWDTGKSDPYVEMRVLSGDARKPVKSEKHTSSIITESLDPQWGGEHGEHFQVMDSLGATGDSWLRLKVWDHDHVAADDFIGMADVKLMEVQAADGHTLKQEVPLTDRKGRDVNGKAGRAKIELQVQLFYNEDRSTLVREHSVAKHCKARPLAWPSQIRRHRLHNALLIYRLCMQRAWPNGFSRMRVLKHTTR